MYLPLVSRVNFGHGFEGAVQVFDILKAVPQIAEERMVQVLEHPPLPDDIPHALRPHHYVPCKLHVEIKPFSAQCPPSSLRMYFKAKVKPVSFLSTMRTLPKAPLPTTRKSLK